MREESCFTLDAAEYLSVVATRYALVLALLGEPQALRVHTLAATAVDPPTATAYALKDAQDGRYQDRASRTPLDFRVERGGVVRSCPPPAHEQG